MTRNNQTRPWRRVPVTLGAALFAAPVLAASLQPDWLEVRVMNAEKGTPLASAAVCLGTSANPNQLGARRSDSQGKVRFVDIGSHPLVLTVSGEGYQGRQQVLEPVYGSRVVVVKLVTGGGGPACDAPQEAAGQTGSGLSVDAVRVRPDINASGGTGVLVSARSSGPVNQIRISEHADFQGADWQPYKAEVPVTLSTGKGVKQLYVQVRRVAQVQGASIEVVSPVKPVSYRVP